jgi:hypothetical protein
MATFQSDIIPKVQVRTGSKDKLDIESICLFLSLGFFPGCRTFYHGLRQHAAGSVTVTDESGRVVSSSRHFEWHHTPREITFEQAVDEYTELFESIVSEHAMDGYTIPVSGGLDSRTLVAACHQLGIPFNGYAYSFRRGIDENRFGREMSRKIGFPFHEFHIEKGTLWSYIDRLSETTECYAEFSHARQYSVFDELKSLGGRFLLGHAGDIFFDGLGLSGPMTEEEQMDYIWKKYVKESGYELATAVWKQWGLQGEFKEFLREVLRSEWQSIRIENPTARLRAFKINTYFNKSSCTNIALFRQFGPNTLPYCDDRIVKFICTVPERWLDARKMQIEYLKRRSPVLASVTWQDHRPFNLYNYQWDRPPYNYPYRAWRKIVRMTTKQDTVRRNWELQYRGEDNMSKLRAHVYRDGRINALIEPATTEKVLASFEHGNAVSNYHATTMIVTLSSFMRLHAGLKEN